MPDREKTRPWLVRQLELAEHDVAHARRMAAALGSSGSSFVMNKPMGELAMAGTVLALADAEWEREAARAAKNVQVRCEPPKQSTEAEAEEQDKND